MFGGDPPDTRRWRRPSIEKGLAPALRLGPDDRDDLGIRGDRQPQQLSGSSMTVFAMAFQAGVG